MLRMARHIAAETGENNLCLAGGVALNCVANGKLLRARCFDRLWIQPAAGDAGGALGAALAVWHLHHGQDRRLPEGRDAMQGACLGPGFTDSEIEAELRTCGARFHRLDETTLIERVADALAAGQALGWMQGRMEFGPRALGARSILADPRSPVMQRQLNLKVKYRESFRPFAPSVLGERVGEWFEHDTDSPYMLLVAAVRKDQRRAPSEAEQALSGIERLKVPRSTVPAVTHVDYSARIQTVHRDTQPRYHALITRFYEKTGCPMLVNTSFNVRGEPIVCTPTDAFKCFMGTELDLLAVGDYLLLKTEQDAGLRENYEERYELD